jgi:hypothetical protein
MTRAAADGVVLLVGDDIGDPAGDGGVVEHGGHAGRGKRRREDGEVADGEYGDAQQHSRQSREEEGVGSLGESDIDDGGEEEGPECG